MKYCNVFGALSAFFEEKEIDAMTRKKTVGGVLLVGGILLLILSLLADVLGIGGAPGFGYKQILGAVVGIVAAIRGYFVVK